VTATLLQINKDPSQQLKIVGRACKITRDAAQYCKSVFGRFWKLISTAGIHFARTELL
jgi:hypothetical protein